jgi:hypothetical protein
MENPMTQVSNRLRITTLAALFTFCTMIMASTGAMAAPAPAPLPPPPPHQAQAATVLIQAADAAGNTLAGILRITGFQVINGQLTALGTLTGAVTPAGATSANAPQTANVALPVIAAAATCPILSLTLGPLNLNVLGLDVTLNQVVLNITAIPGPGNLLGNLLCDVANLLNGGNLTGLLGTLATDLNNILSSLGL